MVHVPLPCALRGTAVIRKKAAETQTKLASTLNLSVGAINLHVSRILEKVGAADRTRAATLAIERGIVRLGE